MEVWILSRHYTSWHLLLRIIEFCENYRLVHFRRFFVNCSRNTLWPHTFESIVSRDGDIKFQWKYRQSNELVERFRLVPFPSKTRSRYIGSEIGTESSKFRLEICIFAEKQCIFVIKYFGENLGKETIYGWNFSPISTRRGEQIHPFRNRKNTTASYHTCILRKIRTARNDW